MALARRPHAIAGCRRRRDRRTAFWLLLPATLGLTVFTFAPIAYALWVSFRTTAAERRIGVGRPIELPASFDDSRFVKSVGTAAMYTAMTLAARSHSASDWQSW